MWHQIHKWKFRFVSIVKGLEKGVGWGGGSLGIIVIKKCELSFITENTHAHMELVIFNISQI